MDSAEDCGSYGTVRGFHVNTAFRAVTTPNAGGAGRPAPPVIHRVTIIVVEWIMKTRNESLNYARKVLESVNAGDLSQAAAYADKMMACQELGEDVPFAGGYFYTDESKTELSLFQCQGQDDLYAEAYQSVWEKLPDHPNRRSWELALRKYGFCIKAMYTFAKDPGDIFSFDVKELLDRSPTYYGTLYSPVIIEENRVVDMAALFIVKPEDPEVRAATIQALGRVAKICGDHFQDDYHWRISEALLSQKG